MMRSLNTSATGMIAQQLNLDVIANNLANVNTTAFKNQRAEFQDLMYQTVVASGAFAGGDQRTPAALQYGLGVRNSSTIGDFGQGAAQSTSNPFDLMIEGDGFFKVLKPDGTPGYTRDGNFSPDANGLLVNAEGYAVQPPITIPQGATNVSISPNGTVMATTAGDGEPQEIGRISLTTFVNPAGLTRIGQNLYGVSAGSGAAQEGNANENGTGSILSGHLEGSNVQIVEEMIRMIQAQRAYEINSKAIQTSDEMLSTLNGLKR